MQKQMQKKAPPRTPTSVLLPTALHSETKKTADSLGMPLSTFIRQAIKVHVERMKHAQSAA